jgi:hypothetical protein
MWVMQRLYRATTSSTALSAKPSGQPNTVQSSTLGQRRYGSGNGGMVAERGGHVDGARRRGGGTLQGCGSVRAAVAARSRLGYWFFRSGGEKLHL